MKGRRLAGRAAVCAPVLAAGTWALWPLGKGPMLDTITEAAPSKRSVEAKALDLAAFRAPLWVAPPAPPAPPAPAAPPPPLKWQLVGIGPRAGKGDSAWEAMVYDPEQDKLLTLKDGDVVRGRTVEAVSKTELRVRDAAGVRTLGLRGEPAPAAPATTTIAKKGTKKVEVRAAENEPVREEE